jgi:hypothetical protein
MPIDGVLAAGRAWVAPLALDTVADPIARRAALDYREADAAATALMPDKRALARLFDPPAMMRAAALCHCSRSGSLLLASYFDGHPDVVTLPLLCGEHLYRFYDEYAQVSLWEQLLVFPTFAATVNSLEADLFQTVAPADYYAAVRALQECHGERPGAEGGRRRQFFQFVHAAFAVACGRAPANAAPLMLYAQHWRDQSLARRFVEDFPQGKFVHTIRDPITSIDSWFDRTTDLHLAEDGGHPELSAQYLNPAASAILSFLEWDRPHTGFAATSRAVRFEDMHLAPEALMRRLANWLGIEFAPILLQSTWNNRPYVVKSGGVSWCGPNPANARRRSRNFNGADRLLMFALLHENFSRWNYDSPRAMRWLPVRLATIALLWVVPTSLEQRNARLVWQRQAVPAWRLGRRRFACGAAPFLVLRRLRMMTGVAVEFMARLAGRRRVLEPL